MASFIDEVEAAQTSRGGTRCGLAIALWSMSPLEQAEVCEAMENRGLESKAIAVALQQRGYDVSEFTIRRCRNNHDHWKSDDDDED